MRETNSSSFLATQKKLGGHCPPYKVCRDNRSENMATGAVGVVQALKDAKVSTVFGIPSIHNIGLYDVLRREPSIRHIVCRHEAAATHMADGYARASGGLGVIISSTGPG